MATEALQRFGIGGVVIVIALVLGITVLPQLDGAINDYALGPDGTDASGDEPDDGNVQLLRLTPLGLIGGMVIGGIGFLVSGTRALRGSA